MSKIKQLPPDQMLQQLFGMAAPTQITGAAAPTYGTQQSPLDSFYSASGATGNKTKNADLPQWLKDIGMKGDAYAGGMLKPELRYGFAYKKGKIYFADGTSYAAKKNKDGSFSYTGADGKPTSYSPTDEQNAYNKKYKASINNQSFLDKATNAVKFELDHGQQILKGVWDHPQQAIFGIDPIGTKIGNAVTGDNAKPQVDQLGGALDSRYADYTARTGNETGYAKPLQGVAHTIAAAYGAKGLGRLAGAGVRSLTGSQAAAGAGTAGAGGGAAGGSVATDASGSGGILSSLFGNGSSSSSAGDWISTLANLYGAYQSSQGAANSQNSLANAMRNATTTLGANTITGPGGVTATTLANGAGGSYGLGSDLEGLRAALAGFSGKSLDAASNGGTLPDILNQRRNAVLDASGTPTAPDFANLSSGVNSAFTQALAGLGRGSAAPGLAATAFRGAGDQLQAASGGFGDVRDQTLATLRAQAQPEETRAYDTLQNDLFSTGRLGSSGGALQTEAFARGLGQADLSRQLAANQEARTTQQNALSIGTGLAGVGSNVSGLDDSLLNSAFGRFGQTAGLSQGLDQTRFGNSVLLNQTGFDRANTNLGNEINLTQLPLALQGSQLGLALQALGGQTSLQQTGLQQFQAALAQAQAAANARIGSGSNVAALAGLQAQLPNSNDIWGQVLTGIGSRVGNGNGSLSNILSGLFGGNKTQQPANPVDGP